MNTMAQYLADAAAMEGQLYVRDILSASENNDFAGQLCELRWPSLEELLSCFLPKSVVSLFGLRIA